MPVLLFILALFATGPDSGMPKARPEFDQPVNAELYLIRPGDKLSVTFIGTKIAPFALTVDAEGQIIHESLGLVDLSEATLASARKLLQGKLNKLYNADQIAISIRETREVSVNISGAVVNPGVYKGYTSDRISDLITLTGGVKSDGSTRRIVFSGGPRDVQVDLDRAIVLGESDLNPALYAGRHIYVPYRSTEVVQIVGEVQNPRVVELIEGDNVELLIKLAGGLTNRADADAVEIISEDGNNDGILSAGDIILVPISKNDPQRSGLSIFGAVEKPGRHHFSEGLTLADLIGLAGGFQSNASQVQTTVFRDADTDIWSNTARGKYPIGNIVGGPNDIASMILRPGDSIYVPVSTGYVKVSGEVRNPGLFPYLSKHDAEYYINLAGGFLADARRDRVFKFDRISKVTSDHSPGVQVHDGDEIIVKIREDVR